MRKGIVQLITIGFVICATVLSSPSPALTQEQGTADLIAPNMPREGIPTNQIIIKYKDTAQINAANAPDAPARLQTLSAVAGVSLSYYRPMSGDAHVLRLPERLPVKDVEEISSRLSALADVEYAEPDYIMQPVLTPNDPQYANQWHYYGTYGINLPLAWDITTGSASVVVAVIDTGYRPHTDMTGRFVQGYDFIVDVQVANDGNGRDNDPKDPGDWITAAESASGHFANCPVTNSSWHGTHVAGTIGANSNNGVGVAGVNWGAKILPVRVLGKCGGYDSDIIDGMRWAAGLTVTGVPANTNPAKVLNLSLGGPVPCSTSTSLQNAINAINATGSIIVVAAGNSNANASGFTPASCAGVITVGATNSSGVRAYFSNYGTPVDVSAPGTWVLSTANTGTQGPAADNYMYYQGTSMAAPHVAGVVSLMATINPTLNYTQTEQILKATVRSFGPGNDCAILGCGTGIVNARAALNTAATSLKRAYIPIARKGAPPASSAIANPGFESGPTGWTKSSAKGWALIMQANELPAGVAPHGGNWAVWLGGRR
ncbi:MAG: S8 family serine peptidase [Anaerolineae bacterium]